MMNKEDWEKGLKAWENIKKQAEIDVEQADLYMAAISKEIEKFK